MKVILYILAAAITCAGCKRDDTVSDTGSAGEPSVGIDPPPEEVSPFPQTPPLPQPAFVKEIAEPHVKARAKAFMSGFVEGYENPDLPERVDDTPEGSGFNYGQNAKIRGVDVADLEISIAGLAKDFTQHFVKYFFEGFISPNSTWSGLDEFETAAFEAGSGFRIDHPERMEATFVQFGYEERLVSGEWSLGHSRSSFRTPEMPKHEYWWLHCLGGAAPEFEDEIPDGLYPVKARGYLSPAGAYGHLNAYPKEFYVIELRKNIKSGNQDASGNLR